MNAESDTSAPAAHQQVLHKAMQVHRDGHHDAARLLYQQVLEVDPRQADALHLMGVLDGLHRARPSRSAANVDAELKALRSARRAGGRRHPPG